MPTRTALWGVHDDQLVEIDRSRLDREDRLEDWIEKKPGIIGIDALVVGRQVRTSYGGYIDLLLMDEDGDLVVVELKRDRSSREVVAQAIDYASWVGDLSRQEVETIASKLHPERLEGAFFKRFGVPLPEKVNANHSIVIVASELDDASERIVSYLQNTHEVDINAVFFSFFKVAGTEVLARAWLADPEQVKEKVESKQSSPWTGLWYVNVAEGPHRNWDECRQFGFVSAGQGRNWSDQLKKLQPGDLFYAYLVKHGYVGLGRVRTPAVPVTEFRLNDGTPLLSAVKTSGMAENANDAEKAEWVVAVEWVKTVSREDARKFPGHFANQSVVCKLKQVPTLNFLRDQFGDSPP